MYTASCADTHLEKTIFKRISQENEHLKDRA